MLAARGRGAARRGAREAAGPHVSGPQLQLLLATQQKLAEVLQQCSELRGGKREGAREAPGEGGEGAVTLQRCRPRWRRVNDLGQQSPKVIFKNNY